jgi:2-keto-3-deoxy-6-phosphogluconate aldolase
MEAAKAVQAGGVEAIEVTMTTPGALDVIRQATSIWKSSPVWGRVRA